MKKLLKVFLLSLLTACSFAFITACGGDGGETGGGDIIVPTTPPKKHIITFVVDGISTTVITEEGKMPVFEGSTDKASDSNGYYSFTGWDKEVVEATGAAVYTAQYEFTEWREYKLRFIYRVDGDKTMQYVMNVKEGSTPSYKDYPGQYKTNKFVFTFDKWSLPIEPITEEFYNANKSSDSYLVYVAEYTPEERLYKVDFVSDDEVLYTENLPYEAIPKYRGEEIKIPAGYNFSHWIGLTPVVSDDMKIELIFTYSDPVQLEWARAMNLLSFSSNKGDNDNRGNVIGEASAVLYMALEVRNTPDLTYSRKYLDRVLENLKFMVSDEGVAPFFDLEPYWCYVPLTAAIAVCKATPTIWARLSSQDQQKYDIVMRSFAYVLTLGTDDDNTYSTGPGLRGNFGKTWNPNYRLANNIPMLFVGQYFDGASAVDKLLLSFDFDTAIADFAKYPCFERAYNCWTAEPLDEDGNRKINPTTGKPYPVAKDFMENGGMAYIFKIDERLGYTGDGQPGGSGVGVRTNYTAGGKNIDNIQGIMQGLLEYTFSGGKVWSDSKVLGDDGIYPATAVNPAHVGTSKAYIMDGTTSPVEGMDGLMKEFNAGDGGTKINGVPTSQTNGKNIRSSCTYNLHNFIMIASAISALESLGVYDCGGTENKDIYKLIWVGLTDFLYKYEHGYMSYSLGKGYETKEGANNDGYYAWKYWWRVNYSENNPYA